MGVKACINMPLASSRPYLVVFQAEISDATHGGRLTLGKILVHLVDALRDVVVSFVE
jgi:hypothetical protein